MSDRAPLYPVSRRHLQAISDEIGIIQHALGALPDLTHGYCTDDVARALLVDLLQAAEIGWAQVAPSAWRAILESAFADDSGRVRNFRGTAGDWLDRAELSRSDEWAFGPREPYECNGDVDHVVFPCGWIVDELRDEVRMYYGAADTRIGLATARLSAVLDYVRACPGGQERRRGDPSQGS